MRSRPWFAIAATLACFAGTQRASAQEEREGAGVAEEQRDSDGVAEDDREDEEQDSASLVDENMLHPVDSFTAYTFKAGEVSYNQPPQLFPLPGWIWVGVTDWLSVEIDTLPLIGGMFVYGHPVPSVNLRFGLFRDEKIAVALETMFQYLEEPHDHFEDMPHVRLPARGSRGWGRVNLSWIVTQRLFLHISDGET